jgi:hypothetical protein
MLARTIVLISLLIVAGASAMSAGTSVAGCPVTEPSNPPFIPPAIFAGVPQSDSFWYGTPALWTSLPNTGDLLLAGRMQKVFYWRTGFDGRIEQKPAIVVRLDRLDAPATPVEITNATNAHFDGTWAMLVGVVTPSAGCWQVTTRYRDAVLTFVARAGD